MTMRKEIEKYVMQFPGAKLSEISKAVGMTPENCCATLRVLSDAKRIERKGCYHNYEYYPRCSYKLAKPSL